MKLKKIILLIVALIATNLSAFEPFTLSFTDRAENNKPNANKTIDVQLTLVNRYTGVAIGSPSPTYQHTATAVKTNAYGMFSVVFEPEAWKTANFTTLDFENGYNNYALRIETKTGGGEYKQIGVLAIGNLINNTVVTEAISGPAKSNFKITLNDGAVVTIPDAGASVDVPFAVAGYTPETVVKPIPSEGYTLSITTYNKADGTGTAKLTRKAGTTSLINAGELMLIADNGNGKTTIANFTDVYYGHSSGLTNANNKAKPIWIITDGEEIGETNDIKTALGEIYEADDTARRQLELPNATSIGEIAFEGCNALTSVFLPVATSIGEQVFYDCPSLSSIFLPAATSIGQYAFSKCTALSSVSLPLATSIGYGAFNSCTGLTSVTIPKAKSFGVRAFSKCTALSSVTLPAAESIGEMTFYSCTGLTSITLPVATSIGKSAFNACTGLSSVILPKAESIGEMTFYSCTGLTSITLPIATNIGERAFSKCTALSSVTLPSATSIGEYAFSDCIGLSSVTLPSATSIGEYAFSDCSGLSSVSLPKAESIGAWAFEQCIGLSSISFGSLITSWGNWVFSDMPTNDITLTFKTGQKTFSGTDDYPGSWTITSNNLQGSTDGNYEFVGKTFKEIKLQD